MRDLRYIILLIHQNRFIKYSDIGIDTFCHAVEQY